MGLVLMMCLMGLVGLLIGKSKGGREVEGFAAGALLGPIGWLFMATRPKARTCQDCKAALPEGARKCQRCGSFVGGAAVAK